MQKIIVHPDSLGFPPIFGVGYKTDFSYLKAFLSQREIEGKNIDFEGDWRLKINIRNFFPEVVSYIVLGFPYPLFFPKLENALLSSYAVVTDYHSVVLRYLKQIDSLLKQQVPSLETRLLVDSGKVFEKELALEAKIGFRGKNSLVIHPVYGSFFFIGIILLSSYVELSIVSESIEGFSCGSCDRCIRLCPANALTINGLNAKQCYSYLTANFSANTHFPFLYGCDICQIVCPYNLQRKEDVLPDFYYEFSLSLLKTNLTQKQFKHYTRHLPLRWIKKKKWEKNLLQIKNSRFL